MKPVIIGIAGGSCSGKTSITRTIESTFCDESVVVIKQDYYYKDQSYMPFEERLLTNYDHPSAFDMDLLIEHIEQLLKNEPIEMPVYDFEQYTRAQETIFVEPAKVIIIEGILVLAEERLRNLFAMKIFVDVEADIRIIRRLERDVRERGRTIESVIHQYMSAVRPMHDLYIEPTKKYAHIIVLEGGNNLVAIDLITTKIKTILETHANV